MKYVVYETGVEERPEAVVIFGDEDQHDSVKVSGEIVSAGFCMVLPGQKDDGKGNMVSTTVIKCLGESITLGMVSRPAEDEILIKNLILRM